jgi:hypothetical protein
LSATTKKFPFLPPEIVFSFFPPARLLHMPLRASKMPYKRFSGLEVYLGIPDGVRNRKKGKITKMNPAGN